jgi:hypothetical protein
MKLLPTALRVLQDGSCHCFFNILSRENFQTVVPDKHKSLGAKTSSCLAHSSSVTVLTATSEMPMVAPGSSSESDELPAPNVGGRESSMRAASARCSVRNQALPAGCTAARGDFFDVRFLSHKTRRDIQQEATTSIPPNNLFNPCQFDFPFRSHLWLQRQACRSRYRWLL